MVLSSMSYNGGSVLMEYKELSYEKRKEYGAPEVLLINYEKFTTYNAGDRARLDLDHRTAPPPTGRPDAR